jgi:hypothetical protein
VLADLQAEFEGRQIDWQLETTFAVPSVNSLLCHASTCFRIGARFLSFGQRQTRCVDGFYGMDDIDFT